MPALGTLIGGLLGLPPSLSVGLILLACCPGGTASNVVRLLFSCTIISGTMRQIVTGDFFLKKKGSFPYFIHWLKYVSSNYSCSYSMAYCAV